MRPVFTVRSVLIGAVIVLLFTGCATKHWAKPGVTAEEFHRDSYACAMESRQSWFETGRSRFGSSTDEKGINKELYRACLRARGYPSTLRAASSSGSGTEA
jgi:hypothetical protein